MNKIELEETDLLTVYVDEQKLPVMYYVKEILLHEHSGEVRGFMLQNLTGQEPKTLIVEQAKRVI